MYVTNRIFSDAGIDEGLHAPRHGVGTEMILTAVAMNINVFCNMKPCSLVEVTDVPEECTVSTFRIENGGNMSLRKFGKRLPDYTMSHLRRQ
jgi:hypothetical protein